MAGVKVAGAFTCVGWHVILCDPIWQVTLCSSVVSFQSMKSYTHLYLYLFNGCILLDNVVCRYGAREPRLDRPRVLSASTDMRDVGTSLPLDRDRSSSVDRLDDDVSYEPSPLRDSSKSFSRSETDLGRPSSVKDNMPSAKLLKQHYEDVVRRNAAVFGGQVVPRRRTRPTENHAQSGPDLNKDEFSKPLSSSDQSDAKTIPTSSSHLRPNYVDRIGPPPKVPLPLAKVSSRYGRSEETPPTIVDLEKPALVADVAASKPLATSQDRSSRPARRSADVEDDSVVKSIEAWKTRRRSNRSDEPPEHERLQRTSDEKPSGITDRYPDSMETGRASPVGGAVQNESTVSEQPASIFGVALRSIPAKSEGGEMKPQTELETKVPELDSHGRLTSSSEPASVPHAEANLPGELGQPRRKTSSDLRLDEVDSNDRGLEVDAVDSAGRRRTSVELAEVPHFPKDSVLLTGGHLSPSPRSSFDGSHHPPPSFPDVKADDHVEDAVFARDLPHAEHSGGSQRNSRSSDSTLPDSSRDDVPATDYSVSAETSS